MLEQDPKNRPSPGNGRSGIFSTKTLRICTATPATKPIETACIPIQRDSRRVFAGSGICTKMQTGRLRMTHLPKFRLRRRRVRIVAGQSRSIGRHEAGMGGTGKSSAPKRETCGMGGGPGATIGPTRGWRGGYGKTPPPQTPTVRDAARKHTASRTFTARKRADSPSPAAQKKFTPSAHATCRKV